MRNLVLCALRENIIRKINSKRMKWARHVPRIRRWEMGTEFLLQKPEDRPLGKLSRKWEDNVINGS
jgi:hypothetical protein